MIKLQLRDPTVLAETDQFFAGSLGALVIKSELLFPALGRSAFLGSEGYRSIPSCAVRITVLAFASAHAAQTELRDPLLHPSGSGAYSGEISGVS